MEDRRAVGYLRISQEDETVENQRIAIMDFAKRKGFTIVAWFMDEAVSGTVPPRQREGYKAMLKFCRDNNVKTIIFYDLSRLARSVEEGLEELKRLADEGFNFYFAGMDFLNYDLDPMMKKKIIMDFLWFAELYVEDVKKRTKQAMERLKKEGKLYHRPTLLHYIALYLSRKEDFNDLTKEDIERAKHKMIKYIGERKVQGLGLRKIHEQFLRDFRELYEDYPNAPRGFKAFYSMVRQLRASII